MDECIEKISLEYPSREAYLKELYQLFGYKSHCFPASVFIYGAFGTGKKCVLLRLLEYLDIKTSVIDCIECYTTKLFYEKIINDLVGHRLSSNNNFENYASCDTTEDFFDILNETKDVRSFVVILKNFNRLHEIDVHILPIMMRLQTLAPALNISCILIGSKSKLDYVLKRGSTPCIEIHCEQYGKNELLKILSLQMDHLRRSMINLITEADEDEQMKQYRLGVLHAMDSSFFIGYFDLFLNTFFGICRNTKELWYLSNANFPIYCKPVIDGVLQPTDLRKLYKNMELPFKMAMNGIYCRIDHDFNYTSVSRCFAEIRIKKQKTIKHCLNEEISLQEKESEFTSAISSAKNEVQQLELPFYTKYLLIAAYLASHNDTKIDKRLFVKNHGKQRKRLQNVRANAVVIKSPEPFISRFIHI